MHLWGLRRYSHCITVCNHNKGHLILRKWWSQDFTITLFFFEIVKLYLEQCESTTQWAIFWISIKSTWQFQWQLLRSQIWITQVGMFISIHCWVVRVGGMAQPEAQAAKVDETLVVETEVTIVERRPQLGTLERDIASGFSSWLIKRKCLGRRRCLYQRRESIYTGL